MKARTFLFHALAVALALGLLVGLPVLTHLDAFRGSAGEGEDATSSASIELPAQPSGNYLVLIRTDLHEDSLTDWEHFFRDEDFEVIFEDIQCLVAEGDATGLQLAERFRAQLPENQMTVREEDPTLLVSKAETGRVDVAVFSSEMADAMQLTPESVSADLTVLTVSGGEENA